MGFDAVLAQTKSALQGDCMRNRVRGREKVAIKGWRIDENVGKRTSVLAPILRTGDLSYQTVVIDGEDEVVEIDSVKGPTVYKMDGTTDYRVYHPNPGGQYGAHGDHEFPKKWQLMSDTEQRVHIHQAAKINRQTKANERFETNAEVPAMDNY